MPEAHVGVPRASTPAASRNLPLQEGIYTVRFTFSGAGLAVTVLPLD